MTKPEDGTMSSDSPGSKTGTDDNSEIRVSVGEERLVVGKAEVERIGARIGLRTHLDEVPVSEPLRTETVQIERVAIDRIFAEPVTIRVEGGVTIIPVVEEVMVRQFRVIEEIRITKHVDTVDHEQTMVLRRQEVVIDEMPDDGAPAPTDPGTA